MHAHLTRSQNENAPRRRRDVDGPIDAWARDHDNAPIEPAQR